MTELKNKISIRKVTELELIGDIAPAKNIDQYILLKIEAGKRMKIEEEGEEPYVLQLAGVHDQLAWSISPAIREIVRKLQQFEDEGIREFQVFPIK